MRGDERVIDAGCGTGRLTGELMERLPQGRLIAIDAATGRPRRDFGDNGAINLRPGVDALDGEAYSMTSAPAVFGDLVITGAMVPEGTPRGPTGDVRAFDVRTDGVGLVENYRTMFNKIIAKDGFDGLIAKMKKKQGANG